MPNFSKRNGYSNNEIILETKSTSLINRIYARFYKEEYDYYDMDFVNKTTTRIEDMMIEMGLTYEFPENGIKKTLNAKKLEKYLIDSDWYIIYDFIEKYIDLLNGKKQIEMISEFNRILENEVSGYRIVNNIVVPITNKQEIETIMFAMNTKFDSVNVHVNKALNLYADRKTPDYENSIKESISAVESMCCIISEQKNATLGSALKKIESKGIHIHPALVKAFESLYGYTSDENGIRHGGIDFTKAPSEDAKYMLISCSAFINYLIEKFEKIN